MTRVACCTLHAGCAWRRGSVLFAVFVMIVLAALVGTTLLYRGDSYAAGVDAQRLERRLRAAAWSGVCLAAERLAAQRDELLAGGSPRLGNDLVIESEGEPRFVVRFEELTEEGVRVTPEAARLNLNTATESMLASAPGFDASLAARLVASRGTGFDSVETALNVITPAGSDSEDGVDDDGMSRFTVFSFDPGVTVGVGGGDGSNDPGPGRRRLVLAGPWDDTKSKALGARLSPEAAKAVEDAMKSQQPPRRPAGLVRAMGRAAVPTAQWAAVLDEVAFVRDEYIAGLIDINTASEAVLASVPGIDAGAAGRIVSTRATLAAGQKAKVTWPLTEGVLPLAGFEQAVNHITVRSLQWRVKVVAVREDEPSGVDQARRPGRVVVLEAVIDVASTRPRVAYMRDATYDDLAAVMRSITREGMDEEWPTIERPLEPSAEVIAGPAQPEAVRGAAARRAEGRAPRGGARRTEAAPATEAEPPLRDPRIGRWRPTRRP